LLLLLHRLLSNNNNGLGVVMGADKDTSSWLATEEQLDPFLSLHGALEDVESDLTVTNVLILSRILIFNPNLEHLTEVLNINFHVLVHPAGVLSTILANIRTPFLKRACLHDNEGIHLVKCTTSVVVKVGFNDVELKMTMSPVGANDSDMRLLHHWLLHSRLLINRLLNNLNMRLLHGLLSNNNNGLGVVVGADKETSSGLSTEE